MTLQLKPITRVRSHEEVVERIQGEILGGRLRKGDRLPGERQLSEMLGVSRATIREALRVLETLQIVRIPSRSGPDGGAIVEAAPGDVLARLLKLQLALELYSMRALVETRVAVEATSVALAATRATPQEVAGLGDVLDAMAASIPDMQAFNQLDTDFHVGLAAASGNALMRQLMHAIRGAIQQEMLNTFERVEDWGATAERLVSDHREILAAVAARDPERARVAVVHHIEGFQPRWRFDEGGGGRTVGPMGD
jgi:GntR family transcriptional regulator, transcriptional repressor for pyruvate dehydrogenase complex